MKKLIATAMVALSALTAVVVSANADYFGTNKQTQEGQLLPGIFDDAEKQGM